MGMKAFPIELEVLPDLTRNVAALVLQTNTPKVTFLFIFLLIRYIESRATHYSEMKEYYTCLQIQLCNIVYIVFRPLLL